MEKVPAEHTRQTEDAEAEAKVEMPHPKHLVVALIAYCPIEHAVHVEADAAKAMVPGGQRMHDESPGTAKVPAAQDAHATMEVPPCAGTCPARQYVHEDIPLALAIVPAVHGAQPAVPFECVPVVHAIHD